MWFSISRPRPMCECRSPRPQFDAEVNLIGTLNVCQGALAAGAQKVVFASSGGTIYGTPSEIPTPETHPQRPESPYGVAKKAGGDYLFYYREIHGLDYAATAFSNVYGPRQDPHGEAGVVAIFAGPVLGAEAAHDLWRRRADPRLRLRRRRRRRARPGCRAAARASSTSVPATRRASTTSTDRWRGPPGSKSRRATRRRGSGSWSVPPSRSNARSEQLGWKPFTSLDEGVGRTLDWFRDRR